MLTRFLLLSLFILIFVAPVFTQPKSADPQARPHKTKAEPKDAFKNWKVEVDPILTPEERAAWDTLKSDDERERFIEIVWRRRDPNPDTEENEYREAYYERLAYVNEHFASGIPGFKTDRGRIYLRFGKPDEIESHPSGGSYQRESWEGGGSTSTYPFERWWYRNLPGRSDMDVEFVDPTGSGEYRIARNPFEKDALLHVPGAGPQGIDQNAYITAAGGWGNPFSSRMKDSEFEWMDRIHFLNQPPPVSFDGLTGTSNPTPIIEDSPLNSSVKVSFFKQSDDRVLVAMTVETDNRDLVFTEQGGIPTARVNISGRITSVAGRRIGFFEDVATTTALPNELIEAKDRKSVYQKAVSLAPGRYKIDVQVRDIVSGSASVRHLGFEVPKFGANLAASSLILASVLEQISDVPVSRQFQIGDKKVIPNLTGRFHRGSPIGIYLQIYNAGIDQTTLRPSVDVEYVLLKNGQKLAGQMEDWRGTTSNGERLTLARLLDSKSLDPGAYEIEIHIRDQVTNQTLVQKAALTIEK
jgi:GWxTD domain-containing protein